jgi:hypothetical protein
MMESKPVKSKNSLYQSAPWLMPIIPATQEAETRRITV